MKTSSCKAKGRNLQKYVRDAFRMKFVSATPESNLVFEDIESRPMGSSGTDIILTPIAKKVIPFDIECKNVEHLNIWTAIEQAEANTKEGRKTLLVIKRNGVKPYAIIEFDEFMRMI